MDREQAIRNLIFGRLAIGASAWTAPRLAARLFGLDVDGNPQAPYLGRLFGVRDAALSVGALTSEGDAQLQWLRAGLACDVADALAGVAGWRGGYLSAPAAVMVTGAAVAFAAVGTGVLRER
jgi:hypothetical protein